MLIPTPWYRTEYIPSTKRQPLPHFDVVSHDLWIMKTHLSYKLRQFYSKNIPEPKFFPQYEENTGKMRMILVYRLGETDVDDPRLLSLANDLFENIPTKAIIMTREDIPHSDNVLNLFLNRKQDFLSENEIEWDGTHFLWRGSGDYSAQAVRLYMEILRYLDHYQTISYFYE